MKWALLLAIVAALAGFLLVARNKNNVCKTFGDYYSNRDTNKNCYYNPDLELEIPDIVKRYGYPVEVHHATTEDGYILTVFRIPFGKNSKPGHRKPVFIQHGIAINSAAFLTIGKKSLGFVLADAGYDVWVGNFRGSRYSRNHTHLSTADSRFWEFSFHEHGIYDVPAQLDLVNRVTKQRVTYIGFSMGGTAGYVYSTLFPDRVQEKMEVFIGLAPGAFMGDIPVLQYVYYLWTAVKQPLQLLTNGEIFPRPPFPKALFKYLCFPYPVQMEICQITDMIMLGWNYEQNDPETLPVTLQYNIDATSVKTVSHFAQLVRSGDFAQFDYGPEENMRIYGSPKPPHYDLSKVTVPNYLIYAPNDRGVHEKNVRRLYDALPEKVKQYGVYRIKDENFNHNDIITGKDAMPLVYKPLIAFLDTKFR